ncbi:hypothetical protein ES703_16667 [subsurface metagenome]
MLGIDHQVGDIKVGVQLLQVIQVHLLKPFLVIDIGLFGECVRFVVIFGPSQYPGDSHLSGTVSLEDDEPRIVLGYYLSRPPS